MSCVRNVAKKHMDFVTKILQGYAIIAVQRYRFALIALVAVYAKTVEKHSLIGKNGVNLAFLST